MKRRYLPSLVAVAFVTASLLLPHPAVAKGPIKVLGRDAKGDAPAGLDLTWLSVGRFRKDLGVLVGFHDINAAARLHNVAHTAWFFAVDDRIFLMEMRTVAVRPQFDLYERTDDGYVPVATGLQGHWDTLNGFIGVLVPMDLVGANTGSVVSGVDDDHTNEDARTRLGSGDMSVAFDGLDTTKRFVIPTWDF